MIVLNEVIDFASESIFSYRILLILTTLRKKVFEMKICST